jgi:uncharacterized glyoxalase superfamily protein PhnB
MSEPAVKPVPEGTHTLTPHLVCANAYDAIEFYKKAFGAVEMFRMPGPDGKLMHASMRIGDSNLMLAEERPRFTWRCPTSTNCLRRRSPQGRR